MSLPTVISLLMECSKVMAHHQEYLVKVYNDKSDDKHTTLYVNRFAKRV